LSAYWDDLYPSEEQLASLTDEELLELAQEDIQELAANAKWTVTRYTVAPGAACYGAKAERGPALKITLAASIE
jgi:hypothetical protein